MNSDKLTTVQAMMEKLEKAIEVGDKEHETTDFYKHLVNIAEIMDNSIDLDEKPQNEDIQSQVCDMWIALAKSSRKLFVTSGQTKKDYIDFSIMSWNMSIVHASQSNIVDCLFNCAISLFLRCRFDGNLTDLNVMINHLERALDLGREGHPDLPSILSQLGDALRIRFNSKGIVMILNKLYNLKEEQLNSSQKMTLSCL
ncbi:hypothetical protein BDQ17DRAFT_526925 [Cyathus striatus]|nr:hypothetical protein BDQ17DRAFT_526925 [Cyathus striatus]